MFPFLGVKPPTTSTGTILCFPNSLSLSTPHFIRMALSASPSAPIPNSRIPILNTIQPVLTVLRLYNPKNSPGLPPNELLSLLPTAVILKLRQMSRTTRAWVDTAETSAFDRICVAFPLEKSPVEAVSALNGIAPHCRHLTVSFNDDEPTLQGSTTLPLMPRLTNIRLKCPNSDAFYPLLSFRHAIESQVLKDLTHLEIYDLTVESIRALRWGTFSSHGNSDAAGTRIWRGLKHLDIKMFPGCLAVGKTEIIGKETAEQRQTRLDKEKEVRRTGFKVLHDWLKSFASTDHLETLKFEWKDHDGPNPLLLDLKGTDRSAEEWFSAPKIEWNGLKEVHLRGVQVTEADILELHKRMKDLQTLIMQPGRWSPPIDAKRLESVRASNVTGISDSSWEVPFMLDIEAEKTNPASGCR